MNIDSERLQLSSSQLLCRMQVFDLSTEISYEETEFDQEITIDLFDGCFQ